MRLSAEPAFVLHARPWRDTSLLVELLSATHGRIGVLARGVQSPRRHALRAALQPLQAIRFDAVQSGELARLLMAEATDVPPPLTGEVALAGFYVNELCLRLVPRQVPQPELYTAYACLRARLHAGEPLAWSLRRFERDLLESQGLGLVLDHDAEGAPIDPAARYRLDPESGPRRVHGDRVATATGSALLALAADVLPPENDVASLRRPLRAVLEHHLGGRRLKSWEMLGELGRLGAGRPVEDSPA